MRLTFVGDISLDKPLLKAAKTKGNNQYDFSRVFCTSDVFRSSDLVVANLETCFGGGKRFNKKPYHYNSPDSFCSAVKEAGIDLVSTANNHCSDEGVKGIARTCRILDACGIEHTGTFASEKEKRYLVKEINGIRVAFYSLTSSVNGTMESMACKDLYQYINLTGFERKSESRLMMYLAYNVRRRLIQVSRSITKKSTISAKSDSLKMNALNKTWMAKIENEMKKAKAESDYLIVLLHSGGQFNIEPGEHTKYLVNMLCDWGADIVIGNHSHTTQRVECKDGKIIAYCLGGFCMSVSADYLVRESLPEYSLALHIDIDEKTKDVSACADILIGTEDEHGYLTVKKADPSSKGYETILKRTNLAPSGEDRI